ncbi:RING-H2 finger protein ATL32-like [Hordeum vulgare]|nr:RING-H2 finger protein ATL32-like [Hordeum vulgare]
MNREGDGEEHEERMREAAELERIGSMRRAVRSRSRSRRPFSRAHSTGHSLSARFDDDLEWFTLRAPGARCHGLSSIPGIHWVLQGADQPSFTQSCIASEVLKILS